MNYEAIEDSIKNRLAAKLAAGIDAKVMEDTEADVNRPVTSPRATVCFFASDFDPSRSTAQISQDDTATFAIMITARKRRGLKGVYDIYNQCAKWLLGWTPTGCSQKIQFKKFQFELNEDGWYTFGLYLETKAMMVEDISEYEIAQAALPKFVKIDIEDTITST